MHLLARLLGDTKHYFINPEINFNLADFNKVRRAAETFQAIMVFPLMGREERKSCTCQPSNVKTRFFLPMSREEPSNHPLLGTYLRAGTCTAAASAHVSYIGPFVRGWVILLDGTKALTGCSIVTSHGIELTWKRHTLASAQWLQQTDITITPNGPR